MAPATYPELHVRDLVCRRSASVPAPQRRARLGARPRSGALRACRVRPRRASTRRTTRSSLGPAARRRPPGPAGRAAPAAGAAGGPRPRWGRIALVAGVAVLVLALLGGVGAWLYARNLDSDLARTDPFAEITGGRPGQDRRRRAEHPAGRQRLAGPGRAGRQARASGARTRSSSCTSRPTTGRPTWSPSPVTCTCTIPKSADADCGAGQRAKINAAFAFGGAAADRADRRVLHRRSDRPRDGDRLRRLQGGHRRPRRRRPEGRADRHVDPPAVPDVHQGHQPHGRRRGAGLRSGSASSSRTATSPGCGTSRSSCRR